MAERGDGLLRRQHLVAGRAVRKPSVRPTLVVRVAATAGQSPQHGPARRGWSVLTGRHPVTWRLKAIRALGAVAARMTAYAHAMLEHRARCPRSRPGCTRCTPCGLKGGLGASGGLVGRRDTMAGRGVGRDRLAAGGADRKSPRRPRCRWRPWSPSCSAVAQCGNSRSSQPSPFSQVPLQIPVAPAALDAGLGAGGLDRELPVTPVMAERGVVSSHSQPSPSHASARLQSARGRHRSCTSRRNIPALVPVAAERGESPRPRLAADSAGEDPSRHSRRSARP